MKILRENLGLTQDEVDERVERASSALDGLRFLRRDDAVGFDG